METYIAMCKFTKKGAKTLKEHPERTEASKKSVEEAGGKWLGSYLTMGPYDLIVIAQLPNAHVAAAMLLGIGAAGNVTTETWRAFPEDEMFKLIDGLKFED